MALSDAIVMNGTTLRVGNGGTGPGAATAGAVVGTGGGSIGAVVVSAGAQVGEYTVRIIAAAAGAGTFRVEDPDGVIIGTGTVGVAFSGGGLAFTVADGTPDFGVGATIPITVTSTSAEVFTAVAEVVDVDPPSAEAAEVEVTHLLSAAKEFKGGLRDFGTATLTINLIPGNLLQEQLEDDAEDGTVRNYRIVHPDGVEGRQFAAFVKAFKVAQVAVDQPLRAAVTLRCTGAVARL